MTPVSSNEMVSFWEAIKSGNVAAARELLSVDTSLVGKNSLAESLHTDGFPLFQAAQQGNLEMVRLLLDHGADRDAKLDVDDPRELGMPIMNALHGRPGHRSSVARSRSESGVGPDIEPNVQSNQ